jgi:transposase-like protein
MDVSEMRRVVRQRVGRAYSAELRRAVLAELSRRRAAGGSMRSVARDIGISYETLRHWLRIAHPALRPVEVAAEAGCVSGLVAVLPCGIRIEGLDVAAVARLARHLS